MDLIDMLVAAIGGLLTLFLYTKIKLRSSEALLGNLDTKKKVQELEGNVTKNNALLEAEEEKRKEEEKTSKEGLKDFFNGDQHE